jgi:hypothetical protein
VTVTANLKIIGKAPAPAPVERAATTTSAGFKNLKLPESIIGAPKAASAAVPAAATTGGAQ